MLPITVIPTRISSHYRANRINPLEFEWIESNRDRRPNRVIEKSHTTIPFPFFYFSFSPLHISIFVPHFFFFTKKEA